MSEGALLVEVERPQHRSYPADVDWAAPFPEHPLDRLLDDAVRRFPDRPCLDFLDRKYTFREAGNLVADHVTRRPPSGTAEGVRIALRARVLSIEKAQRELGYAPRPVEPALRETIAYLLGAAGQNYELRAGTTPVY